MRRRPTSMSMATYSVSLVLMLGKNLSSRNFCARLRVGTTWMRSMVLKGKLLVADMDPLRWKWNAETKNPAEAGSFQCGRGSNYGAVLLAGETPDTELLMKMPNARAALVSVASVHDAS